MELSSQSPKSTNYTLDVISTWLKTGWHNFKSSIKRHWRKFLRNFTKWIDPKLEPYRIHHHTTDHVATPRPEELKAPNFAPTAQEQSPLSSVDDTPRTRAELFEIINQAPHSVFNQRERKMVVNLLDLPNIPTTEIMLPASEIVYVKDSEVLGPLTLDRLYRSGLSHFPVQNSSDELIGCVHTTHFNNLDIRDSVQVSDILDPGLYFIREDYSLERTLNTFLRTNAFFLLATDHYGKIVGMVTFNDLLRFLFGVNLKDSFDRDADRIAVAKRRE